MPKDALGHGSNPRGGAAHQAGVNEIAKPIIVHPSVANTIKGNPNGFSVHPTTGAQPSGGYMVSVPGRTRLLDPSEVSADRVHSFAAANADVFRNPNMHIGGWHNSEDGKFYLDASENIKGRNAAIAAGRARNQIAIFDVKNRREISTGGTGK